MPTTDNPALGQEWVTLQNNIEQYERTALLIKLVAIVLFTTAMIMGLQPLLAAVLILVFWLQEAIFRTSQFRLGVRILHIEDLLRPGMPEQGAAFQLHSDWRAARKGMSGLLNEYCNSALRPTVAFPYPVLLLIDLAVYLQAR